MEQRLRRLKRSWRAFVRELPALASFTLVTYLALHAALGGPALSRAWTAGGHATPEQWTYHLLLERLGFPHHHGSPEAGTVDWRAGDARVAQLLLGAAPTTSVTSGPLAPGAVPLLTLETANAAATRPLLPALQGGTPLDLHQTLRPHAVQPAPPEIPPRTGGAPTI